MKDAWDDALPDFQELPGYQFCPVLEFLKLTLNLALLLSFLFKSSRFR